MDPIKQTTILLPARQTRGTSPEAPEATVTPKDAVTLSGPLATTAAPAPPPLPEAKVAPQAPATPTEERSLQAPPITLQMTDHGLQVVGPDGTLIPVQVGPNGQIQIQQPDLLKALNPEPVTDEPQFVNPLSSIPPRDLGPLGDFLEIPPEHARETIAERQPKVFEWAQQHGKYLAELGKLLKEKDGSKRKVTVDELRAFEKKQNREGVKLDPDMVTMLMEAYQDQGAFADSARFYEEMRQKNDYLPSYEIPREYYIVCLNKQKKVKESIRESEAYINERVQTVHHGPMGFIEASRRNIYRNLGINGEVLGGMGKAYKMVYQEAEKQIDGKVKSADLTALFAQVSNVPTVDWNLDGKRVGDLALEKTAARFNARVEGLKARTRDAAAVEDTLKFVEDATGLKRENWDAAAILDAADPFKAAETLSSKKPDEWAMFKEEVRSAASSALDKLAGKMVRGKATREKLFELGRALTGKPLDGAITEAVCNARIDELMTDVTDRGNVDRDLVKFVEKNVGAPCGRNLLKISRKALEVSRDYYLAGFGVDFEYYPGINWLYNELALGNQRTANLAAPLVQYSVMREGGRTSTDFWNLATQTELATILDQPQTVHDLLPRLLNAAKAGWELQSTSDNLQWFGETKKEEGKDVGLVNFMVRKLAERTEGGFPPKPGFDLNAFITNAQAELRSLKNFSAADSSLSPEDLRQKEITDRIFKKATTFQEVFNSKFVGGSWKFVSRGGVADTPINRQTVRALRQVMFHLGLDKIDRPQDFPVFHSRVHKYIDTKFALYDQKTGERLMEDLDSDVHKKRDKFTQARHDVCHSRISGSGQTNLAVEIMLGQSDCRHTKVTYQGCFDLWKRDHQTRHLQGCLDAILDGHEETFENELTRAQEWNKIQVVSPDLGFFSPMKLRLDENGQPMKYAIERDKKGRPVRTDDGDILRDDKGNPLAIEDHSMPFLAKLDKEGRILRENGFKAVDPFYKDFYPLANTPVDPAGILDDEKGFYLGKVGVPGSDGKPIDFWGKPTKYSGAAPQRIPGECGQVTFGGLEVAMNDITPLLSEDNRLAHLVDAMADMVTGTTKERLLNAVLSRMLDEAAADAHQIWKRAKDRELMDPESAFLGFAPERVLVTRDVAGMSNAQIAEWLKAQAPQADIPEWKLDAVKKAAVGSTIFDPHFLTYAEMLDQQQSVRLSGEVAVAPLALSLYLQDFRRGEDLRYVLDNMLGGKDDLGVKELEKVHRVAFLASQVVVGERSFDHQIDAPKSTGRTVKTQVRTDFQGWHTIHENGLELAKLDEYTLQPAAEWLYKHLEAIQGKSGSAVLEDVVGKLVESAAADAHNVGWKAGKDRAFADPKNPFVGFAPTRQRISCNTPQVAEMSREDIAKFYGVPEISEEKAEAIREATRQAIASKTDKGADVTHQLYKEYTLTLADRPDGGTRMAGANAVPLLTLALYLADFRGEECESIAGLKKVLAGLIAATDKTGLNDVTMLNHVAFQAAQLPYGERAHENEIAETVKSGEMQTLRDRSDITLYQNAGKGGQKENADQVKAGLQWLNRDLDDMVSKL
ncbi:MAG: hypothetical protein FJX76_00250 [Armatimonadetes bacterium]|nr:hypothetical protein [Armatimonadota bacterium]